MIVRSSSLMVAVVALALAGPFLPSALSRG